MALEYVMAISSARRYRLLAERSTYLIADADRGQLVFRCGTGLYGRSFVLFLVGRLIAKLEAVMVATNVTSNRR